MRNRFSLLALSISALLSSQAHSAGFKLHEQSVSAMANAYAGRGAQITDASLLMANPAAITQLSAATWSVGSHFIRVEFDVDNIDARNYAGMPVSGNSSEQVAVNKVVPFGFYAAPLNQQWSWGLGVYAPFGLTADYNNDFAGRYFADTTSVEVVSIQPTLAYKLNEQLSFGLGITLNQSQGSLSKFKDHSALCEMGSAVNALYQGMNVANAGYCQSYYEVSGDDTAIGYILAAHYRPNPELNLSLSYHSKVSYRLTGDSTITNTPISGRNVAGNPQYLNVGDNIPAIDLTTGTLAMAALLTEASQVALTTPESVSFSLDQKLSQAWSWQLSAQWTRWQQFAEIAIRSTEQQGAISANTGLPQNLNEAGLIGYIPEQWRNTWSASLGVTYQVTADWQMKAGYAYDPTPVQDQFRTARMPDNDRQWLTLGSHYQFDHHWSVDMALAQMLMRDSHITEREFNAQQTPLYRSSLNADYSGQATVIGLQLNYLF